MPDPRATVARWTADVAAPGHTYPRPLPVDLEPWYYYVLDGGHSILVAVKQLYQPGRGEDEFLVPAPVKAVLRAGWEIRDGYVVSDLAYDDTLGLVTDPGDDEF